MKWNSLQFFERLTTTSIVAVDIGSAVLKVAEVDPSEEKVILRRCGVAAVEGRDYPQALRQLLADAGVTSRQVVLGIASPEVIVKPFQFPVMPKKELGKAVRLEAEQAVLSGYALSEMAIDWHTLGPSNGSVRGLLAVVPKKVLATRLQVAKAAGLHPVVVDVESLALWNAYWMLIGRHETEPKTVLLINVGAQTTNLIIAKGPDHLILVRDIQMGDQSFTKGRENEWKAEVRDSLGYARSECGLRGLDEVFVTGGGSSRAVIQSLATVVNAPLNSWNPLEQMAFDTEGLSIKKSSGPLLTIAIGLALRQLS